MQAHALGGDAVKDRAVRCSVLLEVWALGADDSACFLACARSVQRGVTLFVIA